MTDQTNAPADYSQFTPAQIIQAMVAGHTVPVGDKVRAAMVLRDGKSALTKKYEADKAKLERATDFIENDLLREADVLGVTGFPTAYGRVVIRNEDKPRLADGGEFSKFVLSTGRTDFYQKRISEKAVKAYQEENNVIVPGVKMHAQRTVVITKS